MDGPFFYFWVWYQLLYTIISGLFFFVFNNWLAIFIIAVFVILYFKFKDNLLDPYDGAGSFMTILYRVIFFTGYGVIIYSILKLYVYN